VGLPVRAKVVVEEGRVDDVWICFHMLLTDETPASDCSS